MTDVRNLMISAMEQLVNPDSSLPVAEQMTEAKAKEVANLGKVLVESAKAEMMYVKAINASQSPTDFVGNMQSEELPAISDAQLQKAVNKRLDSGS